MPANPHYKPEALIDQWHQTADLACEEADRLDKTIHVITGASDRCRLAAEIRQRCADELAAALLVSRCDALTPSNQVSSGGRCVLPVGHVGDHVLRAPTSS